MSTDLEELNPAIRHIVRPIGVSGLPILKKIAREEGTRSKATLNRMVKQAMVLVPKK